MNIELKVLGKESNITSLNELSKSLVDHHSVIDKNRLLCDLNKFLANCRDLFDDDNAMRYICKLITSEDFLANKKNADWLFPVTINRTQIYAWVFVFIYAEKKPPNTINDLQNFISDKFRDYLTLGYTVFGIRSSSYLKEIKDYSIKVISKNLYDLKYMRNSIYMHDQNLFLKNVRDENNYSYTYKNIYGPGRWFEYYNIVFIECLDVFADDNNTYTITVRNAMIEMMEAHLSFNCILDDSNCSNQLIKLFIDLFVNPIGVFTRENDILIRMRNVFIKNMSSLTTSSWKHIDNYHHIWGDFMHELFKLAYINLKGVFLNDNDEFTVKIRSIIAEKINSYYVLCNYSTFSAVIINPQGLCRNPNHPHVLNLIEACCHSATCAAGFSYSSYIIMELNNWYTILSNENQRLNQVMFEIYLKTNKFNCVHSQGVIDKILYCVDPKSIKLKYISDISSIFVLCLNVGNFLFNIFAYNIEYIMSKFGNLQLNIELKNCLMIKPAALGEDILYPTLRDERIISTSCSYLIKFIYDLINSNYQVKLREFVVQIIKSYCDECNVKITEGSLRQICDIFEDIKNSKSDETSKQLAITEIISDEIYKGGNIEISVEEINNINKLANRILSTDLVKQRTLAIVKKVKLDINSQDDIEIVENCIVNVEQIKKAISNTIDLTSDILKEQDSWLKQNYPNLFYSYFIGTLPHRSYMDVLNLYNEILGNGVISNLSELELVIKYCEIKNYDSKDNRPLSICIATLCDKHPILVCMSNIFILNEKNLNLFNVSDNYQLYMGTEKYDIKEIRFPDYLIGIMRYDNYSMSKMEMNANGLYYDQRKKEIERQTAEYHRYLMRERESRNNINIHDNVGGDMDITRFYNRSWI